jgi:hypothetical protein
MDKGCTFVFLTISNIFLLKIKEFGFANTNRQCKKIIYARESSHDGKEMEWKPQTVVNLPDPCSVIFTFQG